MVSECDRFGDGGKELRSGICAMDFGSINAYKLALAPIQGEVR